VALREFSEFVGLDFFNASFINFTISDQSFLN